MYRRSTPNRAGTYMQAARSESTPFRQTGRPDRKYRTAPLKGVWTHQKGGFFHDGRFATLGDVVDHYDQLFGLGLTEAQKSDLVAYLLSL